jgi:hypothetical protein
MNIMEKVALLRQHLEQVPEQARFATLERMRLGASNEDARKAMVLLVFQAEHRGWISAAQATELVRGQA